jgi:hypothetical protein
MGHERVGALPRTIKWIRVVNQIADAAHVDGDVRGLANSTLENVRTQLSNVHRDPGVVAAFQFLIALSLNASSDIDQKRIGPLAINLEANPSALRLANDAGRWIRDNRESSEYAELARKALIDAMTIWTAQESQQLSFVARSDHAQAIWRKTNDGRGFCEVSRLFFSKFVERYLNYFLSREASSHVTSAEDRDRLDTRIAEHLATISHHAFETSRITQSFAAGWYNRHSRTQMPSHEQIQGFLATAFGKIREELAREVESR